MKTVKTLLCASTTLAFLAIPAAPAQADIITVCRATNGDINWPLGSRVDKCRTGEKAFKLERPMGNSKDVSAIADGGQGECSVLAEFLDGDVALCVGHDVHLGYNGNGYGQHCFLWIETTIPLGRTAALLDGVPIRLDFDEVTGRHTDKPYTRAIVTYVDSAQGATGQPDQLGYYTADGYLIQLEDVFLFWGQDACRASARVSARQR